MPVVAAATTPGSWPGVAQPAHEKPARFDPLLLALMAAILTYVWRLQDLYGIFAAIQLPSLASLAAVGFYLLDGDRRRKVKTVTSNRIFRINAFILILAILSIPTSLHDGMSFRFVKDDLSKNFLLMAFVAASIRCIADVRRFAMCVVVGGMIYAYYIRTSVSIGMSGRLGDLIYYDANDIGMMLVCTMPFAIFFLARGKTWLTRGVALVALGMFFEVIVMSGSRGAFLGLIAVALYFLLAFSSLGIGIRTIAIGLGVIAVVALASDQYWVMMKTLLNPKDDYNWSGKSEGGRVEVWKRGMGYMFKRPILGVGVNAFAVAEGSISPGADRQTMGRGWKWSAAHNSFVQIGAELGVFGLLGLVVLVVQGFLTARTGLAPPGKGRRSSDEKMLGQAMAGSIVGYIVAGFFLSQAYAAFMFTLYGMIIGFVKVLAAARSQSEPDARQAALAPRQRTRPLQWQLAAKTGSGNG